MEHDRVTVRDPVTALPFSRKMRLQRSSEFRRVRQEGTRRVKGCLIANCARLPQGATPKLGVITSRRVGPSVARSRARRLLRDAFRQHQHDLTQPATIVLVARKSINGMRFAEVEADYLEALRRFKLLRARV